MIKYVILQVDKMNGKKLSTKNKKGNISRKHISHVKCSTLVCILLASLVSPVFFPLATADPVLYPIFGYATSCDDTPSYQGANVTVMNTNTGVVKYDTTENDGYFGVTFTNIMGHEWSHGDTLIVWVNGTGSYMDWAGKQETLFDENKDPPHRVDISLCPPGAHIPGPPENLHSSLGAVNGSYWILLEWDPPSDIDSDSVVSYQIYRGTHPLEKTYQGSVIGSLIFNDTNLPFNTTYYYSVTAQNAAGESPFSSLVNVTTRLPPTAHFTIQPAKPQPNESILFMDSSLDPDGIITNWTWHFTPNGFRYGEHVVYVFPQPGTYTVTLTVTDNTGDQDTETRTLMLSTPDGKIPGFELLVLMLSLTSMFFVIKKKRPG